MDCEQNPSRARGRGRPVGADSEATRMSILDAAREVIAERGYHAATFQQIAQRAGVSRPTLHYYFATREQVYEILLKQACSQIAECAVTAQREIGLRDQWTAFVVGVQQRIGSDKAAMRFLVATRLEHQRNRQRHAGTDAVVALLAAVHGFHHAIVVQAIAHGELAPDTDPRAVADMLAAMFWGIGFYAGFVDASKFFDIARQLLRVVDGGLLDERVGAPADA